MNELKPYTLPQFQSAKAAAAAAAKAAAKNKKRFEETQKNQQRLQRPVFTVPKAPQAPSPASDYSFSSYSPRTSSSTSSTRSSLYEDDMRSVAATTTTNATTTAPSIRSSYSISHCASYPQQLSQHQQNPNAKPVGSAESHSSSNPSRGPKQDLSQQQPFLHSLPNRDSAAGAFQQHNADSPAGGPIPKIPHSVGPSTVHGNFQSRNLASADGLLASHSPKTEPPNDGRDDFTRYGLEPKYDPSSDSHTAYSEKSADTARPEKAPEMDTNTKPPHFKLPESEFMLTDVRDEPPHGDHKHHSHPHGIPQTIAHIPGKLAHTTHNIHSGHKHNKDYQPEYINLTSAQNRADSQEASELKDDMANEGEHATHHSPRVHRNGNTTDSVTHATSLDTTGGQREKEHRDHTKHIQVHSLGVPDAQPGDAVDSSTLTQPRSQVKQSAQPQMQAHPVQTQSPSPGSTTVSPTNSDSPAYLSSLSSYNNEEEMQTVPEVKESDEFFDAEESVTPEDVASHFSANSLHSTPTSPIPAPVNYDSDDEGVDPLSVDSQQRQSLLHPEVQKSTIAATATPTIASTAEKDDGSSLERPPTLGSPLIKESSPPMTRRQTAPPTNRSSAASTSLHPPHAQHRPSHSFSRRRSVPIHSHAQSHPDSIQLLDEHEQQEVSRLRDSIIAQREYKKKRREFGEDDKVLVGTKVSEGHDNYVTAYNMLTGLRVAVSRCNAKNDRPLTDEDFTARHKLAFDIVGNELTPSAKYDFKFKDYSPWVFRHLRELFKLDPADYLMSLTSKYIVSELGSPGKSGSFFYFSRDYRFIIKTIHHSEHKQLRKILKDYYNHVKANPNTLISQFYGLHRVKLPFGRKIHFIVMNNLFPPHRDIHRTFDLKGSSIGRELPIPLPTSEEEAAALAQGENLQNASMVFKDINWIKAKQTINLGPTKREQFLKQLQVDVELLKRLNIMDYSLLIGIHDLKKGNTEGLRDNLLSVFQPVDSNNTSGKPDELRRVISATSPTALNTQDMPYVVNEHSSLRFYADDGGFRSTNEEDEPLDEIYYLGIIDCLTPYGFVKRVETFWKSLKHPRFALSAIPATEYGDRFFNFMKSVVKSPPVEEKPSRGRRLFNKLTKPIHSTSQGVSQGVHHITSPLFSHQQGNASSSSFQHHHNHQHLHQGHHFAGFSGYHTHSPQVSQGQSPPPPTPAPNSHPGHSQRSSSIGSAAGVTRCNSLGAPGRTSSFGRTDSISSVTSVHTARSQRSASNGHIGPHVNAKPSGAMPPPASSKPLTRTSQDIDVNVLPSLQEVETRAPSLKTELSR